MKPVLALAVAGLFAIASPLVHAESAGTSCNTSAKDAHQDAHSHCGAKGAASQAPSASYTATGSVTGVNKAAGNVTIAHGPVAELHWPAMTMRFGVADKKLFERLATGKKVEFRFVQLGNDYIVTAVN